MLIRVVVSNFMAYGHETEFNMLPSQTVRRNDWHVHNDVPGVPVLRTAVIYGANGAGKSCLIKAIGRLQAMVMHGFLPPAASRDTNKYTGTKVPVTLEIEFMTAKGQYSYGVSYRGSYCVEEWLYSTKRTPKCIFERKSDVATGKTKISLLPAWAVFACASYPLSVPQLRILGTIFIIFAVLAGALQAAGSAAAKTVATRGLVSVEWVSG